MLYKYSIAFLALATFCSLVSAKTNVVDDVEFHDVNVKVADDEVLPKYLIKESTLREESTPKHSVKKTAAKKPAQKTEYLVVKDSYKSSNEPKIKYESNHEPEVQDLQLKVAYSLKDPKPEGALVFPPQYERYEARSEGPHVPEFRTRRIYADVYEKNFVCPKFEKVIIVKVPGKCVCEPFEVRPKMVKAPNADEIEYPLED